MTTLELLKAAYAGSHRASDLTSKAWVRQQIKGAELAEPLQVLREANAAAIELHNRERGLPPVEIKP